MYKYMWVSAFCSRMKSFKEKYHVLEAGGRKWIEFSLISPSVTEL